MKHKAKFIFDLSSDMYKGLNDEIQKHNAFFLVKEYNHEVPHNDRQYIKALIDKHTHDKRLVSRLSKTHTVDHVFTLNR